MIKAVIFDCFGVFYIDPMRAFIDAAPLTQQPQLQAALRGYDLGTVDADDLITAFARTTGLPAKEVQQRIFGPSMVRNGAILALSQSLRPQYKVGMLSNLSPHTMDTYFTREERAQYFDDVVVSGDVGLVKPDPAIFTLACERLGVHPVETVFIDDSKANCAAAARLGIQAIMYTGIVALRRALADIDIR